MKLKTLAMACALAASSAAFAHGPSVTPDLTLYVSGSSAQFNSLQAIADAMFVAGTVDNYTDTSGVVGKNYRAYFGTVASGFGTASGKKMLLIERGKGGSFYGVGPLARAQAIGFMAVNSSNCSAVAGATYPTPTYLCGGTTVNAAPDLGVADEEPALFAGLNLPTSADAGVTLAGLTAAEMTRITTQSEYNVIMGIVATTNVSVSSISRAQVAAILSGNYTTWDQITGNAADASKPIYVETRGAGSGTKAASNAYFLNAPCGLAAGAAVSPAPASTTVRENSSGGTVVSSLNADFNAGNWAVGILGYETQPGASDHFKFLAIDGAAPSNANAKSGAYDYFVGQSIQYRNTTVNGARFVSAGTTWGDAALGFISTATNPAIVTTVPGVMLDPAISGVGIGFDSQTTNGTRFGNTCAPLQLQL